MKNSCDGCTALLDTQYLTKIGVGAYCAQCLELDKKQLPKPLDRWAAQIVKEIDEEIIKELFKDKNERKN